MGKDGWKDGQGAYTRSGPKLRKPAPIPRDHADRPGAGPYSQSEEKLNRLPDPNTSTDPNYGEPKRW
jgi:hypothetical protein